MTTVSRFAALVLTVLAAGCATVPADALRPNVLAANCSDPTPVGATIADNCPGGVSAVTRQTVASDRCIQALLPRDTRHGALNREILC